MCIEIIRTRAALRNLYKMAAEDVSDIPPLEDMTEYLNKLGFSMPSKPSVVEEPVQASSLPSSSKHTGSSGVGSSVTSVQTVQSATKDSDSAKKSSESAMFGGLRKGFLLSTSTSKSSSSAAAKARSKDTTSSEPSVKEPHSKAKTDEQVPRSKAGKGSSAKTRSKDATSSEPSVKEPHSKAKTDEQVPSSKAGKGSSAKTRSKDATSSEPSVKEPHSKAKTDEQVPSSKAGKGSSAKAKKTKRTEKVAASSQDVPLLTAQSGAGKQDDLVIEEVQDALKKGTQHLMKDTEWVSDDLLRKIRANPKLRKGLTDPHFAELLNKFNTNPAEAMKDCSGDPEAMSFFQQYCSLLGQHFTDLGSKEDARREEERQRIMKMPKAERKAKLRELKAVRKRMEPLLHDPKVQDALSDPRVKQIMQVLKADPEKAQRMLAEASPEVLEKIQCLSVLSDTVKEE